MTDTTCTNTSWMALCQESVNSFLAKLLPEPNPNQPDHLHLAMRYAALDAGKRLRPALVYAVGVDLGAPMEMLHRPAASIELMHCYSLIHDDLPAMDDDDLRRGKPSCHKAFDEATAILAGNALQSLAFEVLTKQSLPPERSLMMIQQLAQLSGHNGTIGGQSLDLAAEKQTPSIQHLEKIHTLKTATLIQAAFLLGTLTVDNVPNDHQSILADVAIDMGLAFQIQDDLLDVTSTTEILGKETLADELRNKATYPSLTSLEITRHKIEQLITGCLNKLDLIPYEMKQLRLMINTINLRNS